MDKNLSLLATYFRQASELSLPEIVFSSAFDSRAMLGKVPTGGQKTAIAKNVSRGGVAAVSDVKDVNRASYPSGALSRLSKLENAEVFHAKTVPVTAVVVKAEGSVPESEKKKALREYYYSVVRCHECPLGGARKKFVFGAGNADAPVMVIGEAPGADEDEQGLPFVGKAGQLLTEMLGAIHLDRKKDVFITNVLKCRPPGNRTPESAEIIACRPILIRTIEIIGPRAILLLGRIAAHALLDNAESISKLRSQAHAYQGIPALVTYHPAALLRNAEYKRPAWEDLQKLQALLKDMGIYGTAFS